MPYDEDQLYFLIHTGSRKESGIVDNLVNYAGKFDAEFERVVTWAEANRAKVQEILRSVIGPLELVLDLPHNTFEKTDQGVIIRKGSVKLMPGNLTILPSHMSGDAILVKATEKVKECLFSMSHGTGRIMSRSDAKTVATTFDFSAMRKAVLLPSVIRDSSLTTEGPFAYRDLDDCLSLIQGYVDKVKRFSIIAYAGHL